ncbi:MAG: signal recognition particle protein [Janthinobacterium lividum]
MFSNLGNRLGDIFDKLRKRGALSEVDVEQALREVQKALLEADVALPVVKEFIKAVKEKAIGQEVLRSITPGQMVVKIVHDQLIQTLGQESVDINLAASPVAVVMLVGLQGSGKTTSCAKIARFISLKKRKKVMMASVDVYRPAAQAQLEILGKQAGVDTLPIVQDQQPLDIVKRAHEAARLQGYDVLMIDTAGRLHIDDTLMAELQNLRAFLNPTEVLFVADSMTGQDAVHTAKAFQDQIRLTGVVLTRVDGDARGGAALSIRQITGCPIKFVGVGERIEQLEEFHPDRIASRILDMGDVLSLVEKAVETIDQEESLKLAQKMAKSQFDMEDLAQQLRQISKMGGLGGLMGMLPGINKIKNQIQQAGIDEKMIARQLAIIGSMTLKERRNPKILNGSCRKRIAMGAGVDVPDVNRLMKQYNDMCDMMKRMNKLGQKGFKRQGLRGLFGR